jgi:cytochrome c2
MRSFTMVVALIFAVLFTASAQHKYVGVKMCKACHQSEKQGKQFDIWQKSAHAKAFETLKSAAAEKIKKGAAESPECLGCHAITADAKLTPDGVQCESCHGAGSDYKSMAVMKDKAKAIAAGLIDVKEDAAIEKSCKACHNDKSPTHKEFKFKEMWAKIKHTIPKG